MFLLQRACRRRRPLVRVAVDVADRDQAFTAHELGVLDLPGFPVDAELDLEAARAGGFDTRRASRRCESPAAPLGRSAGPRPTASARSVF